MASSPKLRDALLDSLRVLPGKRDFHLHVLCSAPRKHNTLYQHAHQRPRVYVQDVFVLLSEQPLPSSPTVPPSSGAYGPPSSSSEPPAGLPPRMLVCAIEACIYNLPTTSSAILYISKVDSTGQGSAIPGVPPPTRILVCAFISFFGDARNRASCIPGAKHLWVQLFARAQSQYLFPNSADNGRKKWLSDVQLCAWWKNVLSIVAKSLIGPSREGTRGADCPAASEARLFYLLPGFNELEALQSMGQASASTSSTSDGPVWTYGHPYSQPDIVLPCPPPPVSSNGVPVHNLGHYIPTFDDDPKSRFMDEIAYTTNLDGVKSPPRKKAKVTRGDSATASQAQDLERVKDKDKGDNVKDFRPPGDLGKVTAAEFWERMSFRQECVQGAITGFFTLVVSNLHSTPAFLPSPLASQPGQVSHQIIKRVISSLMTAHEFSSQERGAKGTKVLEKAIKGLCEGVSPALVVPLSRNVDSGSITFELHSMARPRRPDPLSQRPQLGSNSHASLLSVPKTPPHSTTELPDISPNPFPEPELSLEKYEAFIYGVVKVDNLPLRSSAKGSVEEKAEPVVTVLTARKKKKET